MKQKHESPMKPKAHADADILNDVISVCRDGEALYSYVAKQVQDQQSRNMFSDMARIRLKIVKELEAEVTVRGEKPTRSGSLIGGIRRWYIDARHSFSDYQDEEFIAQLEETEARSLAVLRTAVAKAQDPALVLRLSSLVASFQMAYDRMSLLKKSFKKSAGH
ncbi:MAG: hypothetical protein ACI95C_000321 [Pseudohongiellaceae bacterium]|jgi:uncharacterized protein (TIGR02284 family)